MAREEMPGKDVGHVSHSVVIIITILKSYTLD